MTKPYLIRTPEFRVDSGGIRVMWGLYGWLLAKGQVAFINAQCNQESIGIYPEIYHGNELNATKVIRYILQKPGMMGQGTPGVNFRAGPTHFNDSDEIYVFSKVYDQWDVDDDHILFLPIIDLNTFKNHHKIRYNKAFYVGKGQNLEEHPKEAIELTRDMTQDQEKLALFLNDCQVLYVYDRMSAIMECARLCSCPVVYLGDLPLSQLELYEPGMNGLGYREEVDFHCEDFLTHYKELIFIFSKRLDKFIESTQT
jgi:hypothetical protein